MNPVMSTSSPRGWKETETFCHAMRFELQDNVHKGDWSTKPVDPKDPDGPRRPVTLQELVTDTFYHAAKLAVAVRGALEGDESRVSILEYAADVANCAMIVAEQAGALSTDYEHEGPVDYDLDESPGFKDKEKEQLDFSTQDLVKEIMER